MPTEMRSMTRKLMTYRPACVEIDGYSKVAIMRDVSKEGAGFEAPFDVKAGQPIRYRWGNEDFQQGEIVWARGNRFGVEHDQSALTQPLQADYDYRSVRIPTNAGATIFIEGRRIQAELVNFAQRGFCALVNRSLRPGALLTVQVGQKYFEGATARWSESIAQGISLREPMSIPEMAALPSVRA